MPMTGQEPGRREGRGQIRRHRRSGQAMLEFAMVFPLLLLLAISVADYGYYLEHLDNIQSVVRDGARFASEFTTTAEQLPWTSACPNPTWTTTGSTSGWSCAGLSTTTTSSVTLTGTVTISVASTAGFSTEGSFVVSAATSSGQAIVNCTGTSGATFTGCSADSGSGYTIATGTLLEGSSDFTQGIIQQEAESLTIPEGGLPVDNIDCCWQGSSGTGGCPSGSGTTPVLGGTVVIPTSWPTGISATGAPVSCMTISYWKSSDNSYSTSSLSICGWWSSDASSDTGAFQSSAGCQAAPTDTATGDNELVQVTLSYAWSASSPGPVFTVLNNTFGIHVNTSATYSFAVMT